MKKYVLPNSDCCQDYYDIPRGHKAYHCSGEPNKYFYLPRKKNLAHFEVVNCQCECHTGKKPKPKEKAIDTGLRVVEKPVAKTSLTGMKKGEQIRSLIQEGKSNEDILLLVDTSVNSIRWHRSKMKGRE